mgnify:CR=1 FL=1
MARFQINRSVSRVILGVKKALKKVVWNLIRIRIIWLAGTRMRQVMRQQKDYLKKNIHVTAIVGLSDTIAVGAIRAIEDAGKKVPDDISVVGFDGTVISRFYTPRITSMGQDINSIAKRSVELLMKHIHYTLGCEHDYAPHNLIEGESVRRV